MYCIGISQTGNNAFICMSNPQGFSTPACITSNTKIFYCFTEIFHQTLRAVMSSALFCILNIPGTNLGRDSRYPQWYMLWFSSLSLGKQRHSILSRTTTASLHITSPTLFSKSPQQSLLHNICNLRC